MAFGGGNDISLKVFLETAEASGNAERFFKDFLHGVAEGAAAEQKLADGLKKVGNEAKAAGEKIEDGFSRAQRSIISANQALELGKKAASGFVSILNSIPAIVERGSGFDDLASSFENFARQAGITGEALERRLNAALDNTISKRDLYQQSVEAMFAGLKIDQIEVAAQAARAFGDTLGGSTKDNLDQFTNALAKGNDMFFKRLGILVDNARAERAYFQQMGASAAEAEELRRVLDEGTKAEIDRAAVIDVLKKKLEELGTPTEDAADNLDQLRAKSANAFDEIARGIVTNTRFQESLVNVVEAINDFDPQVIVNGFSIIAESIAAPIKLLDQFADGLTSLIQKTNREIDEDAGDRSITKQLLNITDLLSKGGGGDIDATIAAGKQILEVLKRLEDEIKQGNELFASAFSGDLLKLQEQYQSLAKSQGVYAKLLEQEKGATIAAGQATKALNTAVADSVKKVEIQGKTTKATTKTLADWRKELADISSKGKRSVDEVTSSLEKMRSSIGTALPSEVIFEIEAAFGKFALGTKELDDALSKVIEKYAKQKDILQAINQKIAEQVKLTKEGGFAPGDNKSIAEFMQQQNQQAKKDDKSGLGKSLVDALGIEDLSGEIAQEMQGTLDSALSQAFNGLTQAAINGDGRAAAQAAGQAIGTVVGAAIGAYFGQAAGAAAGAQIGGVIGGFVSQIAADLFGSDSAGTKARKAADKFFAEMFDENRLSAIVEGKIQRIRDLVFNKTGGQDLTNSSATAFDGQHFADAFNQLPAQVQAAFQSVGNSMEEFLGLSDDISGQIGAILFNNIGGNIENLQVLVQTLGKSFDELAEKLFEAFFDGTLSLEQLQGDLQGLNDIFTAGLPGIGQVEQAIQNFQIALADDKGSRILFDSLRDIAAESKELGLSFDQMVARIAQAFGLGASQVQQFLEAMKLAGIKSIDDLVNAGNNKLAALALNIKQVSEGNTPTNTPVTDPTVNQTPPGNFSDGKFNFPGGGGSKGSGNTTAKRTADEAKRKAEQAFQNVYKLLTASKQYENILSRLAAKDIDRMEANKEILALYKEITKETKIVADLQEKLEKALKAQDAKKIAELAAKLNEAEKKLKETTESATSFNDSLKLDLSKITPLIGSLNELGALSRAVGVNIEGITNTLVQGFLRGKISLKEFHDELKKSENILGKGIPGAVGAVDQAINNLKEGGLNGGLFSIDAFRDIFTEAKEKFAEQSSETRKQQLAILTKEFNTARDQFQKAIDSGVDPVKIAELRKEFEAADKALNDFLNTPNKIGFEDLRSFIEQTLNPEQAKIFFQTLANSGITSIDELENASNETVTKILSDLADLGFNFGETSQRVKDINKEVDQAITKANGGKDVLQAALDTIKRFNDALVILPNQTNAGSSALAVLAKGFDDIIEKVAELDGRTFENDIIFNIKTNGTASEKALVDVLFGDGSGSANNASSGSPGLTPRQAARRDYLLKKKNRLGRLSASEQQQLNSLIAQAGA
jgi:hypothetical protein